MAGRVVLQMDQTTFATARLLWSLGQRGAMPDMVRPLCLPDGGDLKKGTGTEQNFERNPANQQCQHFRASTCSRAICDTNGGKSLVLGSTRYSEVICIQQLIAGHQ